VKGVGKRILLAEDSPTQAERLRLLLEGHGYVVDVAADGRQGLALLRERPPDLIISDAVMPELDGYAFCQAVKSAQATRRIPFVLLTSQVSPPGSAAGWRLAASAGAAGRSSSSGGAGRRS
jgi:CheY-like chemotaxis protein